MGVASRRARNRELASDEGHSESTSAHLKLFNSTAGARHQTTGIACEQGLSCATCARRAVEGGEESASRSKGENSGAEVGIHRYPRDETNTLRSMAAGREIASRGRRDCSQRSLPGFARHREHGTVQVEDLPGPMAGSVRRIDKRGQRLDREEASLA